MYVVRREAAYKHGHTHAHAYTHARTYSQAHKHIHVHTHIHTHTNMQIHIQHTPVDHPAGPAAAEGGTDPLGSFCLPPVASKSADLAAVAAAAAWPGTHAAG